MASDAEKKATIKEFLRTEVNYEDGKISVLEALGRINARVAESLSPFFSGVDDREKPRRLNLSGQAMQDMVSAQTAMTKIAAEGTELERILGKPTAKDVQDVGNLRIAFGRLGGLDFLGELAPTLREVSGLLNKTLASNRAASVG